MHPIERLRYMARAGDVDTAPLIREAAGALAAFTHDRMELIVACRRLIDRRPTSGPLVWLAARMLTGADAGHDARESAEMIERDTTVRELAHAIPHGDTVGLVSAPELTCRALIPRDDLELLVAAGGDDDQVELSEQMAGVDLVVLEAEALGGGEAFVLSGSRRLAEIAGLHDKPVWLVAGVGRCLPDRMWEAMGERAAPTHRGSDLVECLPLDIIDKVVGPTGLQPVAEARLRTDCALVPELLR